MKKNSTMPNQRSFNLAIFAIAFLLIVASGCSDEDNRVPTKPEVKAADVKRQAYIDSLPIPPEQKAIMKSHMGGPAVSTTMDTAKAQAGSNGPKRQ